MAKHKYTLFIFLSFIFSQATFQALDAPQDISSLSLSGGSGALDSEQCSPNPSTIIKEVPLKGINSVYYPGNILFLNTFSNKTYRSGVLQLSASNLYFGRLMDQETQHEFHANDFLFSITYKNVYKNKISYGTSFKYLYSDIASYSAHVLASSAGLRAKLLSNKVGAGISLENFGFVISDYTNSYDNILPTKVRLAGHFRLTYLPAFLFLDYLYPLQALNKQTIYGIKLKPNDRLIVMLSSSSNKNNLKVNSLYQDMIAGIAIGVRIVLENQHISMSWKNLGPAGNGLGVGITF